MKSYLKFCVFFCFLLQISLCTLAQARLTIKNNSARQMTIKVMKGSSGKGTLHETANISAYSSETIYFSQTGYYFTKSKAVLSGRDPVYKKGQSFKVISGDEGYSVFTLTFTIKESAVPVSSGQSISKSEFESN